MSSYRRHVAYSKLGDYSEAYLCLCERVRDHEVPFKAPDVPLPVPLFDWTDGEMRV